MITWTRQIQKMWVRITKDMFERASTRVQSQCGETGWLEVKVEAHHGSALSYYIIFQLDNFTKNIQEEIPRYLLFAGY